MALGCRHYILQPYYHIFAYDPLIFCGIPHMKKHQKSLFVIATATADQAPWFFWEGEPTCFIKVFRGQHVMLEHIYNHLQFRQLMEWKIPQNMHSTWIGNSHGMGLFQALQTSTCWLSSKHGPNPFQTMGYKGREIELLPIVQLKPSILLLFHVSRADLTVDHIYTTGCWWIASSPSAGCASCRMPFRMLSIVDPLGARKESSSEQWPVEPGWFVIVSLCGHGSIPIDTFLVGWTSISSYFDVHQGYKVLTHCHVD